VETSVERAFFSFKSSLICSFLRLSNSCLTLVRESSRSIATHSKKKKKKEKRKKKRRKEEKEKRRKEKRKKKRREKAVSVE